MKGWNAGYAKVLQQARKELKREPSVRFQAGWEMLGWSEAEQAALQAETAAAEAAAGGAAG